MSYRDKHIFEGWTVNDFILEIEPLFNMIKNKNIPTIKKDFESKKDLKKWIIENQPFYKKHIPEVYSYFLKLSGL
jgi:hypothetical protein